MCEGVRGVAVAMGSNCGDRLGFLREAVRRVDAAGLLLDMRCSHAYETPPERPSDGGAFLNGAVVGATRLSPRRLLDRLLRIETDMGRRRIPGVHGGPRPIDLDLVLFGDRIVDEPGLTLPHPRFHLRAFVLVPVAEVMPDARDPRSGRSLHSLLGQSPSVTLSRAGSLRK